MFLIIITSSKIIENYKRFKKNLPRVQIYYAIKANSEQAILKTLFDKGASFDTASLEEFGQVQCIQQSNYKSHSTKF